MNTSISRVLRAATLTALVGLFASAVQAATVTIYTTIVIPANQFYYGNNNSYKAVGMGDGSQSEGQKPFFRLNSGSVLNSVILLAPGVDGVHYYGSSRMNYVTWNDVGEDASTIKASGTCQMENAKGWSAADKFGQANASTTWTLLNVSETTCGKVIRQNGGTDFTCTFYYNNVRSDRCREAIGRTDSSSTRFRYRTLSVTNFTGSSGWWYGRSSQASPY